MARAALKPIGEELAATVPMDRKGVFSEDGKQTPPIEQKKEKSLSATKKEISVRFLDLQDSTHKNNEEEKKESGRY